MRFAAATLVLLAALAAQPAPAATLPRAWPGSVVGYRDLTGRHGYHRAVSLAVAAWNRLKLGIRFVPARGRSVSVTIVYAAGRCLSGRAGSAPLGFRPAGARVVVRSCPDVVRPLLVAHELGRVLGLGNDDSACSLMNSKGVSDGVRYAVPARCPRRARPGWLPRLVDPRAVRRARAVYTAPGPPVAVSLSVENGLRIDWSQQRRVPRTVVLRALGRCPTAHDVALGAAALVYDKPGFAGPHFAVDTSSLRSHGSYCYRVFNISRYGRATPSPHTVTYVADIPPTAAFSVATAAPSAGSPVAFADGSTDPDGSIVRWRWDFGDPGSGAGDVLDTTDAAAGRAPTHVFAAAGSYTVTLTVTDDGGRSASVTASLTIAAGGGSP